MPMRRRKPWWIRSIFDVPEETIIRLKNPEGPTGENWWSKAWVAVLEDTVEKTKLGRARTCARNGGGSRLRIDAGKIRMGICCSGYTVRDITFLFPKYKEDVWERLVSTIAADAAMTGALLSGDFSEYFVEELMKENIYLLPKNFCDTITFCGCGGVPPCVHVVAAWYLFAEVLDKDPWHLLTLHGLPKYDVIKLVRLVREIEGADLQKLHIPDERLPGGTSDLPTSENPLCFFSIAGDPGPLQQGVTDDCYADPLVLLGPAPANLGGKNLSVRVGSLYPVIQEYADSLVREPDVDEQ